MAEEIVGAQDIVLVKSDSIDTKSIEKIKNTVFKLQSRLTEDLLELQANNTDIRICGKICFDLEEIVESVGGVKIELSLTKNEG